MPSGTRATDTRSVYSRVGISASTKSTYLGKESNSLEDVKAGPVHSERNIYTEYRDPRRDEWETKTQPALKKLPLSTLERKQGFAAEPRSICARAEADHTPRV
jgi:hypothetical protein